MSGFSLLTNHARLLLAIEAEPGLRLREMADRLDLSERGVALILRDLRDSGYVSGRRDGRRVYYAVVDDKRWRQQPLNELLRLLGEEEAPLPE